MTRYRAVAVLIAPMWLSPFSPRANTQVGETTDVITGVVVDVYGQPLTGVEIAAFSLDLEVTRMGVTDRTGGYAILLSDGGGRNRLTARQIGAVLQLEIEALGADAAGDPRAHSGDPAARTAGAGRRPARPGRRASGALRGAMGPAPGARAVPGAASRAGRGRRPSG